MNSIDKFVKRQAQREVDVWVISVFDDETGALRDIAEQHNVVPEHGVQRYKYQTDYVFYNREDAEDFGIDAGLKFPDFGFSDPKHDYMLF